MTRLGVIARADDGGLGNLLTEFCRHLHPDAALLVNLPETRGAYRPERVQEHVGEMRECGNPLARTDIRWLLERSDVIYTAETCYSSHLHEECKEAGVRLVLHVMPELFHASTTADTLVNPTIFCADRFPALLPVPVARDRLPYAHRDECLTFLHPAAPAMLDRNGTRLVLSALSKVQVPCTVRIIGLEKEYNETRVGRVSVELLPRQTEYWEPYAPDVDCLLLPRRYAGLAMPMQEAAACGIPTVALAGTALDGLPGVLAVKSYVQQYARFAGGKFKVRAADVNDLAAAMDRLSMSGVGALSIEADDFAESISWGRQLNPYRALLGLA